MMILPLHCDIRTLSPTDQLLSPVTSRLEEMQKAKPNVTGGGKNLAKVFQGVKEESAGEEKCTK